MQFRSKAKKKSPLSFIFIPNKYAIKIITIAEIIPLKEPAITFPIIMSIELIGDIIYCSNVLNVVLPISIERAVQLNELFIEEKAIIPGIRNSI